MIYVGIDLGGMSAKAGVFKDGELILKERVETNPSDGFQGVAENQKDVIINIRSFQYIVVFIPQQSIFFLPSCHFNDVVSRRGKIGHVV